jgi:outer membrane immunogenic protein
MKNFIFTLMLFTLGTYALAQYPLAKGQNQVNVGFGFSSWGLPVYIGLDHGVHQDISIGGELSFRSYRERYKDYKYNHSVMGASFNGNYHFNTLLDMPSEEWDLYAGLNVGFLYFSSPKDYPGGLRSGLGLGAQVGGRYYFNSKVGINLELGGSNLFAGGKFGLTIKV